MSRCTHIFSQSKQGQPLDPEGRCALKAGHIGQHLSEPALANRRANEHKKERKLAKARWQRENRLPDDCIDCGAGVSKGAKRCRSCSDAHMAPYRREHARKMTEKNKLGG